MQKIFFSPQQTGIGYLIGWWFRHVHAVLPREYRLARWNRIQTFTHPSYEHRQCSLTAVFITEAIGACLCRWGKRVVLFQYTYRHGWNFFAYKCSIYFHKQPKFTLKWFLFYLLYILNKIIYNLINKFN